MSDGRIFEVLEYGSQTVVGFGADGVPNHFYHSECYDELNQLVTETDCATLILDLSGLSFLADGLTGLLRWLENRHVKVVLENAAGMIPVALDQLGIDVQCHAVNPR